MAKTKILPPQLMLLDMFTYNPVTGVIYRKGTSIEAGTTTNIGYRGIKVKSKRYMSHRLAWVMVHGDIDQELEIDHINHIKTDNRLENLRLATHRTNMRNVTRHFDSSSGVTGVTYNKKHKAWYAKIKANQTEIHLGSFDEKLHAAIARKAAEIVLSFHDNHGLVIE